jgi:hypothetical protein
VIESSEISPSLEQSSTYSSGCPRSSFKTTNDRLGQAKPIFRQVSTKSRPLRWVVDLNEGDSVRVRSAPPPMVGRPGAAPPLSVCVVLPCSAISCLKDSPTCPPATNP